MSFTRLSYLIISLFLVNSIDCQSSQLVFLDQGKLIYVPFAMEGESNEVNIIPDFSYAGYMGGGVVLPTDIPIKAIVEPEEGEDSGRIQAAIDLVEGLEPDQNGFRGVVLIKAGNYSLEGLLSIKESGVILRGEGQGLNGTVLHSNPRVDHSVIGIFGSIGISKDAESEQGIITDYVPVGSQTFEVDDASSFEVGDKIVITRTPNQEWVNQLGMDQETLCGGSSGCNGWDPATYAIDNERVITAISGNTISIDIPIVDVIQNLYGGAKVLKVQSSKRVERCAVENMRIQSFYTNNTDESHAWTGIRLKNTENCWVKQVTGQYLAYSTVNIENSNFTTVQDCSYIEPKSKVSGGRRYSFAIQDGLGNLFQRCYTNNGRHDFVTGSRVEGPNVFLDCLAESPRSDIGPHHRWATGTLFDNIRGGSTRVWNRGSSGTGHGWSGAQTMFWNIDSFTGEFRVDSPKGAMNWGIGCVGANQTGAGYWESWGTHVQPRSLYLQQLEDRLGAIAVNSITIPEQKDGEIYDLLADWGGQGNFSEGGFKGEIPIVSFVKPNDIIDVSVWDGSDIEVEATDIDGTIQNVKLLINGEPVASDDEAPFIFTDLTTTIQSVSHEVHYLQAIATDNDGNTSLTRLTILGGDPPPPPPVEEEELSEIRIFPNPVQNGLLNIEMRETGYYTVRIFDVQGRILDYFEFDGLNYQYYSESIVDGIYFLEIHDQEEVVFKSKFVVK